ncbi:SH2 domain protein [Dictyocaulus viviparus]|uniref:SH2 domain protein n=1 Tax=Dictyocaulus viviparus TaxID=29172 RepID=A0A0D8XS89_DICVI|nr:SH2 domain protein [Dictyocaulus viviparus]
MEEDHYDTPWEFLIRPNSVRLSSADAVLFSKRHDATGSVTTDSSQCSPLLHSPSFSNHLVHISNSPVDSKRHSLRADRPKRVDAQNEEETLLEKNIDRIGAEKLLESRGLGDFLLRSRGEGSAALSLRGATGVLHIKLERRGDKWVIGEGPCFRSISSAVHYYRRHPLPIRGSDHLLLNTSLTNTVRL